MILRLAAAAAALSLCIGSASAQWTGASGRITKTTLSAAGNYSFRIYLQDQSSDRLSGCSHSFAYINTSDDNYQAKVATLLSAAAQQKAVNIYYTKDASNFCVIWDFEVFY